MTTDPVTLARDLIRCPSVTPAEGGALALIESVLMQLPQIAQAAVTTFEPDPGVVEIVAYYAFKTGADLPITEISQALRSKLPAYRTLQEQTLSEVERINTRFRTDSWQPIVLVDTQQTPEAVWELYRAADFCIVNSLHDGMNLVAKEFAAARDDEDGVLILSTFAGASRELLEALLVNPFDVSETAAAIETAIGMPRDQRRERMQLMRRTVKENNVYRWAGRMLMDAARVRQRQALARREPSALQRFATDGHK